MEGTSKPPRPTTLAEKIVYRILDKGLAMSTWRNNNEAAYEELLKYRADMVKDVEKILEVTRGPIRKTQGR